MDTHSKRRRTGATVVRRRARLHPKNVATLEAPPAGSRIWWDERQPGLGVRVTAAGVRAYVVKYRVRRSKPARVRVETLGRVGELSLKQAHDLAWKRRDAARNGRDPVAEEQARAAALAAEEQARRLRGDTVAEMIGKFLESKHAQTLRTRTRAEYERLLTREVIPAIGALAPGDVRRADVRGFVEKIAERSGSVADRTLGVLQSLYAWAVKNELLERAPAWPSRPAEEASRDRVLTDDEIRQLWPAIEAECAAHNLLGFAFQLMLVTAQRRGEVLRMRWADISEEATGTWWTLPGEFTKNGRDHRVPLTAMAVEIIEAAKATATLRGFDTSTWVFPADRPSAAGFLCTPSHGVGRVRKRCKGVADWRLHDFRRTAATNMRAADIPRDHLAAVLNHTARGDAPRVTGIYDRYDLGKEKRLALEAWERRLRAIFSGEKRRADVVPITAARA